MPVRRIFPCSSGDRGGQCFPHMPHMTKGNTVGPSDTQSADHRSSRKQSDVVDPNQPFVRAFVDALRDILQHERPRAS
jgi:hypothetical protein